MDADTVCLHRVPSGKGIGGVYHGADTLGLQVSQDMSGAYEVSAGPEKRHDGRTFRTGRARALTRRWSAGPYGGGGGFLRRLRARRWVDLAALTLDRVAHESIMRRYRCKESHPARTATPYSTHATGPLVKRSLTIRWPLVKRSLTITTGVRSVRHHASSDAPEPVTRPTFINAHSAAPYDSRAFRLIMVCSPAHTVQILRINNTRHGDRDHRGDHDRPFRNPSNHRPGSVPTDRPR